MTSVLWANLILAVPFAVAIIGIPMWMTWRHPDTAPGLSGARKKRVATGNRELWRTPAPRPWEGAGPARTDDRSPVVAGRR